MATPPTFSVGSVLTAAQMNKVGLWLISSGSLSSTSTDFANCFSADYNNYRIVIGDLDLSTTTTRPIGLRFSNGGTATTTGYEWWSSYVYSGGGGNEGSAAADNWQITQYSGDTTPSGGFTVDIFNPYASAYTTGVHHAFAYQSGAGGYVNRIGGGTLKNSTSYTGLTVVTSGDSMSGTVYIYGYRK